LYKFRSVFIFDFFLALYAPPFSGEFETLCVVVTLQTEYKRGVSSWNFDVEDLKAQSALVRGCLVDIFSFTKSYSSIPFVITLYGLAY